MGIQVPNSTVHDPQMLIVCYLCDMHLPQPANILLDHDLHAYLGDTGFAKAQRGGEASLRSGGEITGRIVCSPGFRTQMYSTASVVNSPMALQWV